MEASFEPKTIENSAAKKQWSRLGIRHHHGINIPLFSLHSSQSAGIGEFTDLLPLLPWCADLGLDIIQLLPLNDTGRDSSPYGANSAFALNPIHLGLAHLPFLTDNAKLTALLHTIQTHSKSKKVEYASIYPLRDHFLRKYYQFYASKIQSEPAYQLFIDQNKWLPTYSLYKSLKATHQYASWEDWPAELQHYSPELEAKLSSLYQNEISYHTFLQYLCFQQMAEVKNVQKIIMCF